MICHCFYIAHVPITSGHELGHNPGSGVQGGLKSTVHKVNDSPPKIHAPENSGSSQRRDGRHRSRSRQRPHHRQRKRSRSHKRSRSSTRSHSSIRSRSGHRSSHHREPKKSKKSKNEDKALVTKAEMEKMMYNQMLYIESVAGQKKGGTTVWVSKITKHVLIKY